MIKGDSKLLFSARKKQGGSQSTNDNAKGPAKSAGAMLRRYGEQALRDVSWQSSSLPSSPSIFSKC